MQTMRIFRVGSTAVVTEEISHWWVADLAIGGPALCISMRNGKQINLGPENAPDGSDGYAIEKGLLEFLSRWT
ncbi:hypothetical protein [Novosphingobium clariflavum]|uniref:Uncharacterized protein n=1 Tax=Novosphingobium clariflavum TaxID=2029884 RepID=A0ABV6S8N6_9SPHN|nr:hypothetical protein [Novosphingobium clariflavum]